MATTVQQIIDAAFARSSKSNPETAAPAELVASVRGALRGLFAYGARVNPHYFGDSANVVFSAPGWARPANAEAVYRLEHTGSEVVVVSFEDRTAEAGKPSVYAFGRIYRPARAVAPDPQAGTMTFYFAKRPTDPVSVDSVLDAAWPEAFNELLALEVAMYEALKDGRGDELAPLKVDRDRWAMLFTSFLEHETMNTRRRFGQVPRFSTQTKFPLPTLLAGGG